MRVSILAFSTILNSSQFVGHTCLAKRTFTLFVLMTGLRSSTNSLQVHEPLAHIQVGVVYLEPIAGSFVSGAMMNRGIKRPAEDTAADGAETPKAATLEQVGDVRLEFGGDAGSFMLASSHLLRLASPVFNRMLQSGMREARQSVIKVDVASKEFITFYSLLGLWAWSADKVTEENVDSFLAISDYYQVDIIKQTCENLLLSLPSTGTRLLQAHKHNLKRQYQRCITDLSQKSTKEDLEVLRQSEPDILLEVALNKQNMLNSVMGWEGQIVQIAALVEPVVVSDEMDQVLTRPGPTKDALLKIFALVGYMPKLLQLSKQQTAMTEGEGQSQ